MVDNNDMERPHSFRTDNGGEFTIRSHVDYSNSAGIRRKYTIPGTPRQNAVVEGDIWACIERRPCGSSRVVAAFPLASMSP